MINVVSAMPIRTVLITTLAESFEMKIRGIPATLSTCSGTHTQSSASPTAYAFASSPRRPPTLHYAVSTSSGDLVWTRHKFGSSWARLWIGGGSMRRSAGRRGSR